MTTAHTLHALCAAAGLLTTALVLGRLALRDRRAWLAEVRVLDLSKYEPAVRAKGEG